MRYVQCPAEPFTPKIGLLSYFGNVTWTIADYKPTFSYQTRSKSAPWIVQQDVTQKMLVSKETNKLLSRDVEAMLAITEEGCV